jgi:hypothetical protein
MYLNPKVTTPLIVVDMVKVRGFEVVEYLCRTRDKANVCLWRIVPEVSEEEISDLSIDGMRERTTSGTSFKNWSRKPILIQHGLLDCSMSWFFH